MKEESNRDRAARPFAHRPVVVAHRGGNLGADLALSDVGGAGAIELDVHRFRGEIEVRHSKALWPTRRLFEGRRLLPTQAPRPPLERVLVALPQRPPLWIDLKGPDPRLGRGARTLTSEREPLWVSARCWWQLLPFRKRPETATFVSVGSRWQRGLALRAVSLGWADGIVIHRRLATADFLAAAAPSMAIAVWAVEDRTQARELLGLGVAGLIIDDVTLISRVRADIATDHRYAVEDL